MIDSFTLPSFKSDVDDYVLKSKGRSDLDRTAEGQSKSGIFTGAYAINPVNDKKTQAKLHTYSKTTFSCHNPQGGSNENKNDTGKWNRKFFMKFH